jgi:ABC-type glutathione transport system ATPase component
VSIVSVKDLRVVHRTGRNVAPWRRSAQGEGVVAVDGVSFAVEHGEILGIVGESGSGKSTVARCVTGFTRPTSGTVWLDGRAVQGPRTLQDRRRVQMVFQDPYSSLNPSMSLLHTIREPIAVHKLRPRGEVDARAKELMELVGLDPALANAKPRRLSGGQRQRVSIARALAVEPDVLVADEPVSALDVSVQAVILNLLSDLRAQLSMSIILISHDLAVVSHLCDRIAVMQQGRIVEIGDRETLFSSPADPYTAGLLKAVPPHPWADQDHTTLEQTQESEDASSRH